MHDLGTLGGLQSSAAAINASGQVVGYSDNNNPSSPEVHAFLYTGGSMHDLGTLGGTYSSAPGINNGGQVVGFSLTSGNDFHAFLYANGSMNDLGTLGGTGSQAYAINTAGVIVGNASTSSGATDAFVDSGGVMTDLNSLINPNSGWVLQGATSINDAGQIVGMGTIDLGPGLGVQTHAFFAHAAVRTGALEPDIDHPWHRRRNVFPGDPPRRQVTTHWLIVCLCDHAIGAAWLQEIIRLEPHELDKVPQLSDLAGRVAESTVGYFFASLTGLSVATLPGARDGAGRRLRAHNRRTADSGRGEIPALDRFRPRHAGIEIVPGENREQRNIRPLDFASG